MRPSTPWPIAENTTPSALFTESLRSWPPDQHPTRRFLGMSDLAIPSRAAEVDAAWITSALRAGGLKTTATVTSIEATARGSGL